jgi:hypothetical protein
MPFAPGRIRMSSACTLISNRTTNQTISQLAHGGNKNEWLSLENLPRTVELGHAAVCLCRRAARGCAHLRLAWVRWGNGARTGGSGSTLGVTAAAVLSLVSSHLKRVASNQPCDTRALPLLTEILRDADAGAMYLAECIGQCIAAFGDDGLQTLVKLLGDAAPHVRRRAAQGLIYTNSPRAIDPLRTILNDCDAQVRETAEIALKVLPPSRSGR